MSNSNNTRATFGLLPSDVISLLIKRFWDNRRNLKQLLKGEVVFPITFALKPPTGVAALNQIDHLRMFVVGWREFHTQNYDKGCHVIFETRNFRDLGAQSIPVSLQVNHFNALFSLLGHEKLNTLNRWRNKFSKLHQALAPNDSQEKLLFDAMIDTLESIDSLEENALNLVAITIKQLKKSMGLGLYLRELPIIGVDTKFLEVNLKLIETLSTSLLDEEIESIGLLSWLGVYSKPKDWLLIKPLCLKTQSKLGGLPLFRLSTDILLRFELPAKRILVVENEQSCLALPQIDDTIAVAGGGKNIAWMAAGWLVPKHIGYFGDIDSEGFGILSDARSKQPHLKSLMMDEQTVLNFKDRMVNETETKIINSHHLTLEEQHLYEQLKARVFNYTRLEQERISADYINQKLYEWIQSTK